MYRILLLLLICNLQLSAQYRCIPHTYAGGNPGDATVSDYPSAYAPVGIGYSLNPVWSNVIPINFPFQFNGLPVNAFKISSTGIVTFDTLATNPAPALSNALLPDPGIPDNSVCIRGISAWYQASASNDSELLYYYQTTPGGLQQLWISFRYYSDSIITNANYSTVWAIVLEGSTNNIYIVNQCNYTGYDGIVTLGIQVNDTTAFNMPGSPLSGQAGSSLNAFDNIYYSFIPGNALSVDGALTKALQYDYLDSGDAPFLPGVQLLNLGVDTIFNLDLEYTINGGSVMTESYSSLNIPCGDILNLYITTPWSPAVGNYNFEYRISMINGSVDEDSSNNNLDQHIYVAQTMPNRRVMIEEFKGLWCLWCGYWTVRLDSVMALNTSKASITKYDDYLNVPWEQYDHAARRNFYDVNSYPNALGNGRILDNDPSLFAGCPWNVTQNLIDSLYDLPGLFYVQPQLTFDGFDATITATVTSAVDFSPGTHCRIMVSLVTDTVRFGGPQGTSGEDHFYNTNWKLFPDGNGTYIGAPAVGQVDSVSFSITVADTMVNVNEMHVVVFVQDTITGEIYQCGEAPAVLLCQPVQTTVLYDICAGDSVNIYGTWYNSFGNHPYVFTSASGCDSMEINIIHPHPIGATITLNTAANKIQWTSLYGGTPADSVQYLWYNYLNNQTYPVTLSGSGYPNPFTPPGTGWYALIMENKYNCIDTSNIVSYAGPGDTLIVTTICDGDSILVGWNYYSLAGLYVDSLISQSATDSIILTVLFVTSLDTTIVYSGDSLIAHAGYASYVWIDCATGLAVPGGNTNTLLVTAGSYYVHMTDSNGCAVLTPCYTITGFTDILDENKFTIYPNPASQEVIFQIPENKESTFIISDMRGRLVTSGKASPGKSIVNIANLLPGIYFVIFNDNGKQVNKKLVVY